MRKFFIWQVAAYLAWAAFIIYLAWRIVSFNGERSVYPLFLQSGFNWAAGVSIYRDPGYQYYPGFAALMSLFTYLPAPKILGALLWSGLIICAFLSAATAFARTFIPSPPLRAVFFLALLPPAIEGLLCQQTNPLIAATLMYGTVLIGREKWTLGMILLLFGGAIKIAPLAIPGLLVVVFWRCLTWRCVFGLVLYGGLPFLCGDWQYVMNSYREWYGFLQGEDGLRHAYRDFWSLWEYATLGVVLNNSKGIDLAMYRGVQVGVAGFLAAWLAYRRYGARHKLADNDAAIAAFAAGSWWLLLLGISTELATVAIAAPTIAWGLVHAYENRRDVALMTTAFILILLGSNGDLEYYLAQTLPHTDLPKLLLPLGGILFGTWLLRRLGGNHAQIL